MTSKQTSPQVHYVTPAEAALMATIDSIVDNASLQDIHRILIDYDFLRDYTVQCLCNRFQSLGIRDYTTQACACVGASRYLFRNRHIATLNYKKITAVAK